MIRVETISTAIYRLYPHDALLYNPNFGVLFFPSSAYDKRFYFFRCTKPIKAKKNE